MTEAIGEGQFRYETEEGWAKLPEAYDFPDASGVTVDSQDNVHILNRGPHPVIVLDKDGNFLRSRGEGEFDARAHGIHASPDDFIWTVNDNQHCIKKYSPEGKLVLTIGVEGQEAEKWSERPFNRPTNMAISPNTGDVYVTDGYGNSRIHRYTAGGKHIVSWGAPGVDPGEFQVPHNVVIDADENVYVTDRENYRLQSSIAAAALKPYGMTSTGLRPSAWTAKAPSTSASNSWRTSCSTTAGWVTA